MLRPGSIEFGNPGLLRSWHVMNEWETSELVGCLPESPCCAKTYSASEPRSLSIPVHIYIRHYRLNLVVKYAAPNAAQPPALNTHPVPV